MPVEHLACAGSSSSCQSKPGALERRRFLRVGHVVRAASRMRANSRCGPRSRRGQLRVVVIGEVLERRRRAPLLALEQQRHEGRGQDQRGRRSSAGRRSISCAVRSPRRGCRPGRGSAGSRRSGRRRGRCGAAVAAPAVTASSGRRTRRPASSACARSLERAEVGVVAVRSPVRTACSAWWKSSLHCGVQAVAAGLGAADAGAGRSGRSRRSARAAGRAAPRARRPRAASSSRKWMAEVSKMAWTASSRRPSSGSRAATSRRCR